jgi:hypothetical protein
MLLFLALFSILSIRERRWFWTSRPSSVLSLALGADAVAGLLIGWRGLGELRPLSASATMVIVSYTAACCLGLNDLVKSGWYRERERAAVAGEPLTKGSASKVQCELDEHQ